MQQRTLSRAKEKERERETKEEGDQKRGRWRTRWTPLQFIAYALTTCLQAFLSFPHLCGFRLSCKQTKKSPSALLPHTVRQTVSLSLSVSSYQFPVLFLRSPTGTSADWQTGEVQQYLQHKLPEPAWFPKDHTPYIGDQMNCFGSIYRTKLNRTEQSIGPPFGHHWATADLATEAVMLEKSIFMLVKGRTVNGDSYSVLRWITAQIQAMNSALK